MNERNGMYFLHGSDTKITQIDFSKSRLRTDFGRGFYLSDKLDGARVWALRSAGLSGIAYVVKFEVDNVVFDSAVLNTKRFDGATREWLDFVQENRRRKSKENEHLGEPRHKYDIVSGLIADDKAADVVDRYCRDKITWQQALNEVKYIPDIYQISLHTEKSLGYIKAVEYQHYKNGKWSGWIKI